MPLAGMIPSGKEWVTKSGRLGVAVVAVLMACATNLCQVRSLPSANQSMLK